MTQKKRQWHQYVGVCGMQTAARKGREGKGAFRPKAYWLSSRGGPARRHLSTLSAWGGVRCVPVKREREKRAAQAATGSTQSSTFVRCVLAARGGAWSGGGWRGGRACVRGRASGMRMCDSASGSARRAGVRTYIIVFIIIIIFINNNYVSTKRPS